MKVIDKVFQKCPCCMEEHEIKTVEVQEDTVFKKKNVEYDAIYQYCDLSDELYMNEDQIQLNDIRMKNAFRKSEGLLTTDDIEAIRLKYHISQKDLCILLGWGEKTITRYEGHQVQDRAHDSILRKINQDPEWFLSLLEESRTSLSEASYVRSSTAAKHWYLDQREQYVRKAINARYANYQDNEECNGNTRLSLDKTVDVIRYFAASPDITSLCRMKLLKMMWIADSTSFKIRKHTITGLVYRASSDGPVPEDDYAIIGLKGVPFKKIDLGDMETYIFTLEDNSSFPSLTIDDKEILDRTIERFGVLNKIEINTLLKDETEICETPVDDIIHFRISD